MAKKRLRKVGGYFMNNIKNDKNYMRKVIEDITTINKYMTGVETYEQFISDDILIDAVMFRLVQMIENIKKISIEYKENNHQIEWGKIIGFRNGIVHEYGETDYTIVYETIRNNLPQLIELFEDYLDNL